jgi:hypothetical protein
MVVEHHHGRVVEHLVGPLVSFSFSVTKIFVTVWFAKYCLKYTVVQIVQNAIGVLRWKYTCFSFLDNFF